MQPMECSKHCWLAVCDGSTWLLQILDEYDRVCRPSMLDETPCSVAELRKHADFNRYFNVLPFDYNRVRLRVRRWRLHCVPVKSAAAADGPSRACIVGLGFRV